MADVPYVATINAGLSGYIRGCIPSNNGSDATNDIDFSVGAAFDGTRGYAVAAMTKQANAGWALGTAAGGMASSAGTPKTFSATTDYHWFLLLNPSTGETDYGCDTLVTAADLLTTAAVSSAGFTVALRDTSFRTGGSAAWPEFHAKEIAFGLVEYLADDPAFEHAKDWGAADNAAQTATLALVPGGIQVNAIIGVLFQDSSASANSSLLVSSFDQDDTAPDSTSTAFLATISLVSNGGGNARGSCITKVRTSTSRTLRYRGDGTTIDSAAAFCTMGWEDSRL